jgi:hypothetical protein
LRNLCLEFESHLKSYRKQSDDFHDNLNTHIRNTRDSVTEVNKLLLEKTSITELHRLTDNRMTSNELNLLLDDVYKHIDQKAEL